MKQTVVVAHMLDRAGDIYARDVFLLCGEQKNKFILNLKYPSDAEYSFFLQKCMNHFSEIILFSKMFNLIYVISKLII